MPFELEVTSVTEVDGLPRVSGKLISGRYFGPEEVEVESREGRKFVTSIGSMSGGELKGWPILPEHGATLHLQLLSQIPFPIHSGMLLRGIGFESGGPEGRVLRTDLLEDPLFWASHYYLSIGDEDHDESELCEPLFGLSAEAIFAFYSQHLHSESQPKPWPYFRIPVLGESGFEVEYAEGAEYQTRYKIYDAEGAVVAGYESGHFSLPSFRWTELQLVRNALGRHDGARAMLLMFPGIYVSESETSSAEAVLRLCLEDLDLFPQGDRQMLVKNVVAHGTIPCEWRIDPKHGWICDGQYAQRNPESLLSRLSLGEFMRISRFFESIAASRGMHWMGLGE